MNIYQLIGSNRLSEVLAVATLFTSIGCSSPTSTNPTRSTVANEVAVSLCSRLEQCVGQDVFLSQYPSGEGECEKEAVAHVSNGTQPSDCSEEQLNQCMTDVATYSCDTMGPSAPIPSSCACTNNL